MKIEALHHFHDFKTAEEWAKKFSPSPARMDLFETMLKSIKQLGESHFHIVELGIGPGFLADFLLNRLKNITYEGIDCSEPMRQLAAKRLESFKDRTTFTTANLTDDNWIKQVSQPPKVVVTTWALHDLFTQDNIHSVYRNTYQLLQNDGIFLNGDFIKPDNIKVEYEGGRLEIKTHLDLLQSVGFQSADCLKEFEKNIKNPTTANNYACFEAKK